MRPHTLEGAGGPRHPPSLPHKLGMPGEVGHGASHTEGPRGPVLLLVGAQGAFLGGDGGE